MLLLTKPFCVLFSPFSKETEHRTIICSVAVIQLTCELKGRNQAKANIIVVIRRLDVVTVRRATVLRTVVPATATYHTVRPF